MKKLAKTLLSLVLALTVVLSLGVCAFADGADAAGEENVETVDIAFDLSSAIGCALLMRSVDYDDIRLNGIRYLPDAADGVMLVQLGDLAAAKLLTDYAAEAQAAGLDLSKLYISAGRVHVDKTGMTAEDAAALSAAVDAFMSSYKTSVSIGDVFSLANGAQLKLKLCVVNFWYSAAAGSTEKKETKLDFVAFSTRTYGYNDNGSFSEKATPYGDEKYFNFTAASYPKSVKPLDLTTVFFQYYSYDNVMNTTGGAPGQTHVGWVGIARAADDTNDYYVKVIFDPDDSTNGSKFYNNDSDCKYLPTSGDTVSAFNNSVYAISENTNEPSDPKRLARSVEIYTDKNGTNLVYEIEIKDDTPTLDKVQDRDDYNYLENPKLKTDPSDNKLDTDGKVAYVPENYVEETHDENSAEVTVHGAMRCWEHDKKGENGACSKCGYIEPVPESTSITDPMELTATLSPAPTTETPNTTLTTTTTNPNTTTTTPTTTPQSTTTTETTNTTTTTTTHTIDPNIATTPTTTTGASQPTPTTTTTVPQSTTTTEPANTTTTTPEPTTGVPAGNTESTPSAA